MTVARAEPFTMSQPGWPNRNSQTIKLTVAIRLVRKYADKIPARETIQRDFGVSRATANRWRLALRDSLGGEGLA